MNRDRPKVTTHLAAGFTPRVHPRSGANLRRAKPQERRRAERGKKPDRPARSRRFEGRVRNAACEKRPRRMIRVEPGRREPAPADVERAIDERAIEQRSRLHRLPQTEGCSKARDVMGSRPTEPTRRKRARTPNPSATPATPTHARLERKTARADAADVGLRKARGPAVKTPKRDRPEGWHPPDNALRPASAVGDQTSREAPDRACRRRR